MSRISLCSGTLESIHENPISGIKDESSIVSSDRERNSLISESLENLITDSANVNETGTGTDTDADSNVGSGTNENSHSDEPEEAETESEPKLTPLSKSGRLKKYLKLVFFSSLAFVSAYESDQRHILTSYTKSVAPFIVPVEVVPASARGRNYAMALSGVSAAYHFIIVAIHLMDMLFVIKPLRRLFQDGSEGECTLIVLSTMWWLIGTWVMTSIHGVAGDGRGQFNLYFSTWLAMITNLNIFETWLVAAGHESVYQAVRSWPNRAPGWIMIFIATLSCMLSIVDIFLRYNDADLTERLSTIYDSIPTVQWYCLIAACVFSFTTAFGFSLIELFRREDYHVRNIKSTFEFSLEGICLAVMVFVWVPIVVVATTDGAASEVGNSYFLTWASTLVVIQTFINWMQDWRKGVHDILLRQDREYRDAQSRVEPMHPIFYEEADEDSEVGET